MTDEEYEAELQARTPEQWTALAEKAKADAEMQKTRNIWSG